jgi:hypothetical protein
MLESALAYAARGWAVLPVRAGSKAPLTPHGVKDATRCDVTMREWWSRWPEAGVAIACGAVSGGLIVLDCDTAEFSWALERACGPLPETFTVATGRGTHRYFISPEPVRTQKLAPHLDLRGEDSYVVAPPSVHPSGMRYRIANNVEPAPLPQPLRDLLGKPVANPLTATANDLLEEKISEGRRNSRLTSLAGTMRRRGMTGEAIEAALLADNGKRCEPPLPEDEVRRIAKSVSRYRPAGAPPDSRQPYASTAADGAHPTALSESDEGESAATTLVRFGRLHAELFHSGEECFGTVEVDDHLETYSLRSRSFRSWLSKIFFEEKKRAASGEALTSAITTLEGFARFEAPERPAYLRIAGQDGRIFVDLGDESWRVVEIDARGFRIIESKDSPVRFRRAHGMQALAPPESGGNLQDLHLFLNFATEADLILLIGWLVGALHPSGPYPVLVLHGEQGSSKTTTARMLRGLVDPNLAPIRSEPREPRDLMVAANNGWICGFDNMSALPAWLSDAVCRLSTGGGFSARTLYTDQDETIFFAKRPTIITGIEELATRGDLLDRAIVVYLPRIPEQKCLSEEKLFKAYYAARPRLVGALFSAVSRALANCDSTTLDSLPRMADFALWVAAAEPALGCEPGTFVRAYIDNRMMANELPIETPIGEAIRKVPLPWKGTATELLVQLETKIDERAKRSKSWPGSGRGLSNSLRRLAPNLRTVGINVEFSRESGTGGRRLIDLSENGGDSSSPSSQGRKGSVCDVRDDERRQSLDANVNQLKVAGEL